MTQDLWKYSALDLLKLYKSKKTSPVEVVKSIIVRIKSINHKVNAFTEFNEAKILKQAKLSSERWAKNKIKGRLDGVPVSIKDLILTKDYSTYRGSLIKSLPNYSKKDAPVVRRIKESGGIILGKTSTPEFGHKGTTQSKKYGKTANPWDLQTNAGGSSGGACAAVSAGMGPLAVGTDGGGSVRIPASFCGLFGHKPTFGKIPAYPISPFGTVANIGPISRSVRDSAILMNVIAKPDTDDWHSLPLENKDYEKNNIVDVKSIKIGYLKTWGMDKYFENFKVEEEVQNKVNQAVSYLKKDGLKINHIKTLNWPNNPANIFKTMWHLGAANLARKIDKKEFSKIDKNFIKFINLGKKCDVFDLMDAEAKRAENGTYISSLFKKYDVLIGPTLPVVPFDINRNIPKDWNQRDLFCWTPFTYPFNLTKNPAATINCNFSEGHLPIGLQIVAPMYKDFICFKVSMYFEKVFSLTNQWPHIIH